jgi:20S proteasome alpha/beta subunit
MASKNLIRVALTLWCFIGCAFILYPTAVSGTSEFFSEHGSLLSADLADKCARNGGMVVAAKGDNCAVLISYTSSSSSSSSKRRRGGCDLSIPPSSDGVVRAQQHKDNSGEENGEGENDRNEKDDGNGGSSLSRLEDMSYTERIKLLDDATVLSSVGLTADANYLADALFEEIAQHRFVFGSSITAARLAKVLSTMAHGRTLQRSLRPFGVHSCILGSDTEGGGTAALTDPPTATGSDYGDDDEKKQQQQQQLGLYEVDVLGNIYPCRWTCIGSTREQAARVVRELDRASHSLSSATDATTLSKVCLACLRRAMLKGQEEEEESSSAGPLSLRAHELQIAVVEEEGEGGVMAAKVLSRARVGSLLLL